MCVCVCTYAYICACINVYNIYEIICSVSECKIKPAGLAVLTLQGLLHSLQSVNFIYFFFFKAINFYSLI